MKERMTLTASVLWLITSFLCLILPIFVPSSPNPSAFPTDPISISTAVMFVLSFPGGLLSLLFSPLIDLALGIDPNSIQGGYLNVKLMFVLGLAQWFWIVPRFFSRRTCRHARSLTSITTNGLFECGSEGGFEILDSRSRTPVERIIDRDPSE